MDQNKMIDKNVNYIKYFLNLIKDFDESTILNPDLNGIETPKPIHMEREKERKLQEKRDKKKSAD